MLFPFVMLMLVLSVTLSLPTFLGLLNETHEKACPVLATLGTAALIGSLFLLGVRLGWPAAAAVSLVAGLFDRFVYAPRSRFSRRLGTGTAFALLLVGIAMADRLGPHT
ncbi:hypothetical protein MKI84_10855 [Ancylobacter sp. A5.8]|uniref:hypothetical protein n=1 Tax=Ancylobacter gelatini TaxID=2919920 RepID=UPI001F4E7187|nr:hypothetical protein [Ancylobacter gelatini]MCJ8143413.1 hypothetical protein [Ancylobacter gelatini]